MKRHTFTPQKAEKSTTPVAESYKEETTNIQDQVVLRNEVPGASTVSESVDGRKSFYSAELRKLDSYMNDKKEKEFCDLLKNVLTSPVKEEATSRIHIWLYTACQNNLNEIISGLLDKGCNPFATFGGDSAILYTLSKGDIEMLRILLKNAHKATIKELEEALLFAASISNTSGIFKECFMTFLEHKGFSEKIKDIINAKDKKNRTALHYACKQRIDKAILLILGHGGNLLAKDDDDEMPISQVPRETLEDFLDTKMHNKPKEPLTYTYDFLKASVSNGDKAQQNDKTLDIPRIDLLFEMVSIPELQNLLLHPVLVSFTMMVWINYRIIFFLNLLFYLVVSSYITFYVMNISDLDVTPSHEHRVILGVLLIILLLRETLQLYVRPSSYFLHVENYFELSLVGFGGHLVIEGCGVSISSKSAMGTFCPHSSAFSILFAWGTFLYLLGKHPIFSVQVGMFTLVLKNFLKLLAVYILLILSFALSFYVLFRDCPDGCPDGNPFGEKGNAIFKTLIMISGEFDAGNIPFSTFNITSQIIFIAFVFLIPIILLNLLSGLAVHDTNIIRNDAQLHTHISRIKYLASLENLVFKISRTSSIFRSFSKALGLLDCNEKGEAKHIDYVNSGNFLWILISRMLSFLEPESSISRKTWQYQKTVDEKNERNEEGQRRSQSHKKLIKIEKKCNENCVNIVRISEKLFECNSICQQLLEMVEALKKGLGGHENSIEDILKSMHSINSSLQEMKGTLSTKKIYLEMLGITKTLKGLETKLQALEGKMDVVDKLAHDVEVIQSNTRDIRYMNDVRQKLTSIEAFMASLQ